MSAAMQPPVRPHDRAGPLRVGTRGSPLALIQTRLFIDAPEAGVFARTVEEHPIRTTGDAVQNRRLAEIGGKGCSPRRSTRRWPTAGSTSRCTA